MRFLALVALGIFVLCFTPAPIANPYDFNRDRRVNATDELIARYHHSGASPLQLIDLSGAGAPGAGATLTSAPSIASLLPARTPQALPAVPLPLATPTAASQEAAARDAVLAASGAQGSSRLEPWSPIWAWLCEYEQVAAKSLPAKKDSLGPRAVDALLAAYGP